MKWWELWVNWEQHFSCGLWAKRANKGEDFHQLTRCDLTWSYHFSSHVIFLSWSRFRVVLSMWWSWLGDCKFEKKASLNSACAISLFIVCPWSGVRWPYSECVIIVSATNRQQVSVQWERVNSDCQCATVMTGPLQLETCEGEFDSVMWSVLPCQFSVSFHPTKEQLWASSFRLALHFNPEHSGTKPTICSGNWA